MPGYNVHIHAYGDPEFLRSALDSIPEGVDVRVFDGRYADFGDESDPDLTPAFKPICSQFGADYYGPPPWNRPFDGDSALREPVHRKAMWAFDKLPADEWTLKLDTDERLALFDVDLDKLTDRYKYCPVIEMGESERVHVARLFKPKHWTPWVDDCLLPRDLFPLGSDLEALAAAYTDDDFVGLRFARRAELLGIEIANDGADRPVEYQRRRVDQLEAMGRDDRFTELKGRVEGAE